MATAWQPSWYNEKHSTAWERVKDAMKRDWEQTKSDLHVKGAVDLHQGVGDTVKQATGKEPVPPAWNEVENAHRFGYAAREQFGHGGWTSDLENKIKTDWEAGKHAASEDWKEVKHYVRRGYEYDTLGDKR